jgi:methionyl-tRNA formyltransferase
LAALRALDLDLLVVDGTGILREPVFTAARHGAVNLHCGRLPQYRGAPPAFWELYEGERDIGVTVHRVTAQVDAGPILAQCVLPLDPVPATDPVAYAEAVWRTQLRPAGLRLLREVVSGLRDGSIHETPQPPSTGEVHRIPDAGQVRELRRRVRARRASGSGGRA